MKKFYAFAFAAAAALSMNAQIYLCGSGTVNGETIGWDNNGVLSPVEVKAAADGNYVFTLVGSDMKISTVNGTTWDEFNTGGVQLADGATFSIAGVTAVGGQTLALETSDNPGNITPPAKATYTVTVKGDLSEINLFTTDKLSVPALYVRGGMNGWGTGDEWELTTKDYVYYTFNAEGATAFTAGEEFKFADADWGAMNYGGDGDGPIEITPDPEEKTIVKSNGNNFALTEDFEGLVLLSLDPEDMYVIFGYEGEIPEADGVSDVCIDVNTRVEYFNLNGVRVANPENGIFIARQGNKVSKVVVR